MPFKSKAQRRKFAELLVNGKITDEAYERWNQSTGRKELPERVRIRKKPTTKRATAKRATPKRATPKRATAKRKPTARKTKAKGSRAGARRGRAAARNR
jgi:hypothetical protein